jgi:anti-anti-sigma regulatory factor
MTVAKNTARSLATPRSVPRSPIARAPLGRVAIVALKGIVQRDALEACDYTIMSAGDDVRGFVVDLTEAQHLDYRSVDILVKRRKQLRPRSRELAVAASQSDVRHIIRAMAGSEVPVFATLDEAVGWASGESQEKAVAAPHARSRATSGR